METTSGTPAIATSSTADPGYTERLQRLGGRRWKELLNVQAPYSWNLRRLQLGRTLEVGSGIGRNLGHLHGNGVGVDHNAESVALARSRGLEAYTSEDFLHTKYAAAGAFDSLLVAHVFEHMSAPDGVDLLQTYLPFIRPRGHVVFITPQEVGYRSDDTHVRFVDFTALSELAGRVGVSPVRQYSFPMPRAAGKVFRYNEFVFVGRTG